MTSLDIAYTFTAKIYLLPTSGGGRRKAVYSHYRPAFSFNTIQYFSGEVTLIDKEELAPGEMALASIKLLPSRHIRKSLKSGDAFKITEGTHVIGFGTIEQIEEMSTMH